jgi:hypothetical protein
VHLWRSGQIIERQKWSQLWSITVGPLVLMVVEVPALGLVTLLVVVPATGVGLLLVGSAYDLVRSRRRRPRAGGSV